MLQTPGKEKVLRVGKNQFKVSLPCGIFVINAVKPKWKAEIIHKSFDFISEKQSKYYYHKAYKAVGVYLKKIRDLAKRKDQISLPGF